MLVFLETFIADIVVIWDNDFSQIGCFVDFIHRNYVAFVADHLMVSLDREIPQNFCWVIFSYLWRLVLVPWYLFLDKSMSQSQENMNVFADVIIAFEVFCWWETIATSTLMWWMVSFSTRQIRHVSSTSTLKTCFSIYLAETACSWMAALVDSVDLFRVEDLSHWLIRLLST